MGNGRHERSAGFASDGGSVYRLEVSCCNHQVLPFLGLVQTLLSTDVSKRKAFAFSQEKKNAKDKLMESYLLIPASTDVLAFSFLEMQILYIVKRNKLIIVFYSDYYISLITK